MITNVNSYSFERSPPVDFAPTNIRYINDLNEFELVIYIHNLGKIYFNATNEFELLQTCNLWYEQDVINSLNSCTPREYITNTTNQWYPTGNYTNVISSQQNHGPYNYAANKHQIMTNEII